MSKIVRLHNSGLVLLIGCMLWRGSFPTWTKANEVQPGDETSFKKQDQVSPTAAQRADAQVEDLIRRIQNRKSSVDDQDYVWQTGANLDAPYNIRFLRAAASLELSAEDKAQSKAQSSAISLYNESLVTDSLGVLLESDNAWTLPLLQRQFPRLSRESQATLLEKMLYLEFFQSRPLYITLAQTSLQQGLAVKREKLRLEDARGLMVLLTAASLVIGNDATLSETTRTQVRPLVRATLQKFPSWPEAWWAALLNRALGPAELATARKLYTDPRTPVYLKEPLSMVLAPTDPQAAQWVNKHVQRLLSGLGKYDDKGVLKAMKEGKSNPRANFDYLELLDIIGHLRFFVHPTAESLIFQCVAAPNEEINQPAFLVALERYPVRTLDLLIKQRTQSKTPTQKADYEAFLMLLAQRHPEYEERVRALLPTYDAKLKNLRFKGLDGAFSRLDDYNNFSGEQT